MCTASCAQRHQQWAHEEPRRRNEPSDIAGPPSPSPRRSLPPRAQVYGGCVSVWFKLIGAGESFVKPGRTEYADPVCASINNHTLPVIAHGTAPYTSPIHERAEPPRRRPAV